MSRQCLMLPESGISPKQHNSECACSSFVGKAKGGTVCKPRLMNLNQPNWGPESSPRSGLCPSLVLSSADGSSCHLITKWYYCPSLLRKLNRTLKWNRTSSVCGLNSPAILHKTPPISQKGGVLCEAPASPPSCSQVSYLMSLASLPRSQNAEKKRVVPPYSFFLRHHTLATLEPCLLLLLGLSQEPAFQSPNSFTLSFSIPGLFQRS